MRLNYSWVVMLNDFGKQNCIDMRVPASEKSRGMFLLGRESGTQSTQLYTSSNCSSVSSQSICRNINKTDYHSISGYYILNSPPMHHQSKKADQQPHQNKHKNQTFLILVYGLPASGKSTFSQRIKKQFFPDALLICGDDIEKVIKQDKNYETHLSQLPPHDLITELKKIQNSQELSKKKPQFSPQNWKQSRKLIEQFVEKVIQNVSVILDDDFLLRSQRKVYRKISWKNQKKYLQIFMDTPVNICLENLKKRSSQNNDCIITQQTVEKASYKLQNDHQALYSIKLDIVQRKNVTQSDIENQLKIVEIRPNDPNDPEFYNQKPKHEHSNQELLQLQARAFVNSVMKLSQQGFQQMYGKKMESKKQLGNLMNEWKKLYVKSQNKSIDIQEINKNFIEYLQKHH